MRPQANRCQAWERCYFSGFLAARELFRGSLDTTIKGFTLTHESIREVFKEICAVDVADDVKFELADISDIREDDDYPGIRVALKSNYPRSVYP